MNANTFHNLVASRANEIASQADLTICNFHYVDAGICISLDIEEDGKKARTVFFAQDEDASNWREEIAALADKANVEPGVALMYILDGAGVDMNPQP